MRPDAYKQERSRQYLAKQRAKHGAKATGTVEKVESAEARRIRKLSSNHDRYEGEDDVSSEDDFDISSTQQLEALLEAVKLKGTSTIPGQDKIMEEEPCKTFDKWSSLNLEDLASVMANETVTEEEIITLPAWFANYWKSLVHQRKKEKLEPEIVERLDIKSLQKKMRQAPTAKPEAPVDDLADDQKQDRGELESWLDDVLDSV